MKIIEYKNNQEDLLKDLLLQREIPERISNIVKSIIEDVKKYKDEALIRYTQEFDQWDASKGFVVDQEEMERAWKSLGNEDKEAILFAKERIESFHKRQLERSWFIEEKEGFFGMMVNPIEKVGVYVPGGRASLPSTVLMNVIPAKIAGVKEIYVASPAPQGYRNPYILGCCHICQVNELYLVGGAQAVAAFAFGTETVPKVDKIAGPGNIYVAEAKRQLFGTVGIDSIAGPSEILIIADDKANPDYIAADLLSQAEHDPMARSILVTTSRKIIEKVRKSIEEQLERLPTKETASESLKNNGKIILCESLLQATEIANLIAPEHLEILTENPWEILPYIKNAGAIFLGELSPEPIGDYVAGPNHTLPTASTARFSSPLGVYDFVKRTSIIQLSSCGFRKLSKYGVKLAEIEGLIAHKNSIKIRTERGKG